MRADVPFNFGELLIYKPTNQKCSVSAYNVTDTGFTIFVSGYKEPWCAEALPEELERVNK